MEKNYSVVDTTVSEITSNPETREYKNKKNDLPLYGIISLMISLIGVLVVTLNFTSLNISYGTPILLISAILAGEGINVDIIRGASIIGLILSMVFLLISLSPVFQFIVAIFIQ